MLASLGGRHGLRSLWHTMEAISTPILEVRAGKRWLWVLLCRMLECRHWQTVWVCLWLHRRKSGSIGLGCTKIGHLRLHRRVGEKFRLGCASVCEAWT